MSQGTLFPTFFFYTKHFLKYFITVQIQAFFLCFMLWALKFQIIVILEPLDRHHLPSIPVISKHTFFFSISSLENNWINPVIVSNVSSASGISYFVQFSKTSTSKIHEITHMQRIIGFVPLHRSSARVFWDMLWNFRNLRHELKDYFKSGSFYRTCHYS